MSVAKQLERMFRRRIRERGEDYFLRGRVSFMDQTGDQEDGALLLTVKGSIDYTVELGALGSTLTVWCDCDDYLSNYDGCKHIWAAILAADAKGLLDEELRTIEWELPEDFEDDEPYFRYESRPSPPPRAAWLRFFDALGSPLPTTAQPSGTRIEDVAYVLQPPPSPAAALTLEILGRARKKNGDWGKWTRLGGRRLDSLRDLGPAENETLGLLHSRSYTPIIDHWTTIAAGMAPWWIERLARAGNLYLRSSGELEPVTWDDGQPWRFNVAVRRDEKLAKYKIEGSIAREGETLPLESVMFTIGGVLVAGHRAARFENPHAAAGWLGGLKAAGAIEIPFAERDSFREALLHAPLAGVSLPEDLGWEVVDAVPRPLLALRNDQWSSELQGDLLFDYDGWRVAGRSAQLQTSIDRKLIRRNPAKEQEARDRLLSLPVTSVWDGYRVRAPHLEEVVRTLTAAGWAIEIESQPVRVADDFEVEITSGIDWFDLHADAVFGDERISFPEILTAASRNQSMLRLGDGSLALLSTDWLDAIGPLADLGEKQSDSIRYRKSQALLIDALLLTKKRKTDAAFETLREKVARAAPSPRREPRSLQGELRPYQRSGLGWFEFLRETELGGCLADDMGLGKTVQVLALLESQRGKKRGPSLVVAPKSLLFNWSAEARRFAPQLRVIEHHGSERIKGTEHFADFDLVLTTYATMRLDVSHLAETEFEYVILDESQAIKNAGSQVSKAARLLRGRHRLALTGTPIENHIGELWSLFEFLDPGLLGTSRAFRRSFASKGVPPERREALARALRPLILRRTKQQVTPELPARIEQTLYCELEPKQRKQYDELRDYYRDSLLGRIEKEGLAKSQMHVLEALLRLRQVACHPALVTQDGDAGAAKIDLLFDELDEVLAAGHRALIFSQFTSLLAIVRRTLEERRIDYLYLDGKTTDRQSIVERFQSEEGPPLFLISLKAGGFGLNLTSADYVFLLDPWWNPAVEAQAVDRAHRIGRTRPVIAYRLIARDTVEEKILDLQSRKRDLADAILTEENSVLRKIEVEDLEMLLS